MNDLQKVTELVELQLVGIDGNAYSLMGAFQSAARSQGTPKEEIAAVIAECTSGDYNHLLCTLMDNTFTPDDDEDFEDEDEDEEGYYDSNGYYHDYEDEFEDEYGDDEDEDA